MNKKKWVFIGFLAIWVSAVFADKNSFKVFSIAENRTVKNFIESTECNSQFDDSHPDSFEPNKTFLTFYGDSLGDFVEEPLYGYFGWDKYLTMMNPRNQNILVMDNFAKM